MLGRRDAQTSIFDNDQRNLGHVREKTFYGYLAQHMQILRPILSVMVRSLGPGRLRLAAVKFAQRLDRPYKR